MDEPEQKAIEELRESGYSAYNYGILFSTTNPDYARIEIIPWIEIRHITYNIVPHDRNQSRLTLDLWSGSGGFDITPKPGADIENIYRYLANKFTGSLTK